MIDTRKELERWTDGPVEFHFANILSPWVRRALIAGGFGTGEDVSPAEVAPVVAGGEASPGQWKLEGSATLHKGKATQDIESGSQDDDLKGRSTPSTSAGGPLLSPLTPFFHIDLEAAVRSAELSAKRLNASEPPHEQ